MERTHSEINWITKKIKINKSCISGRRNTKASAKTTKATKNKWKTKDVTVNFQAKSTPNPQAHGVSCTAT